MPDWARSVSNPAGKQGPNSSELLGKAIFESLIRSPLLLGDLPESRVFDRHSLTLPDPLPPLNLHQKLGHLCEQALAHLLERSSDFDLLETSLPVRKDRHHTLGELDFLLREKKNGSLIHLELATKFYLAVPTKAGLTLPGPDARDDYFKKLSRLRNHQLTLATRHRESLPEAYREHEILPRHLVLGALFDHINAREPSLPEAIHPQARRGRWLTIMELPSHFDTTTLLLIPKPLWPVPPDLLGDLDLPAFSPNNLVDRCQMILAPCGTTLFVTPPGYPNHQGAGMR